MPCKLGSECRRPSHDGLKNGVFLTDIDSSLDAFHMSRDPQHEDERRCLDQSEDRRV